MNTKNIPAIIMLTAGLASSIVMFRMHYELYDMLRILLLVFFVFYVLGHLVKKLLDKFCVLNEKEAQQEEEASESEESEEKKDTSEDDENKDGSVIEKA